MLSFSFVCVVPLSVQANDWVSIEGNVQLADGTPICAMVLANGQYMFSCDGTGAYSLTVPLDDEGQVTLFSFADGFAPFRITQATSGFPYTVEMQAAISGSGDDSIVGSWDTSDDMGVGYVTFHSDGTYVFLLPPGGCDLNDMDYDGIEAGNFSYDADKMLLTATSVTRDDNAYCGFANFSSPYDLADYRVWQEGDVLYLQAIDGSDSMAWPKLP